MREYHIDGIKFESSYDMARYITEISSNELEEENKDKDEFFKEVLSDLDNLKLGNVLDYYGTEVWVEDLLPDDFTLELYDSDDNWIKQIMKSENIEDIWKYEEENPLDENKYRYSIWCSQYDNETGNEMISFPLY